MENFEKMGAFYLGKLFNPAKGAVEDDLLLYDSRDLTTHAMCVGMTGSGKTGLCISLLEEAAIDGIPAIAIDPKGDLGNLLLSFPELRPEDFRPWVDEGEAARKGQSPEQYAASTAKTWEKGIGQWGQDGARIARFKEAVDVAIYTPGSNAGLPLTVLKSFDAPPEELLDDGDAFRERISTTVSSLLALLGIDADPIQSREHIFLSTILQKAWQEGRSLDIAGLIREIQDPPFERIGVMELTTFFPQKERFGLSMALNNLLASPGFSAWMEGESLDVSRLLWTPEGKPRLTILSIAHLPEAERMFFVTLLLNEVVAWMRTQAGTTSLRALLYMDEVFGYLPPTANPPSKTPMLALLKQARAYGLGVVLATQNPVDLDYKGLSNTGTWFLGRLQTERDQKRVLDGLEGISSSGVPFDRAATEATLAGLQSRVFLMHNVHDEAPALFHTRWVLSYLRGPLTRRQIRTLMADRKALAEEASSTESAKAAGTANQAAKEAEADTNERPMVPSEVPELFLPEDRRAPEGARRLYRPALLGTAKLHFVSATDNVDLWREVSLLTPLSGDDLPADPWEELSPLGEGEPETEGDPEEDLGFAQLPAGAANARQMARWGKALAAHLYRSEKVDIWRCAKPKSKSRPGETEGEFRVRLSQLAREDRDLALGKLEKKFAPKLQRAQERIHNAEARVEKEEEQYSQLKMQTAVSIGATLLGGLFGRRSRRSASTTLGRLSRSGKEKGDIRRAEEKVELEKEKLAVLEEEFQTEMAELQGPVDTASLELVYKPVKPRKADIAITRLALAWAPWHVSKDGIAEPAFTAE